MPELIFLVEEAPEGGYTAHSLGTSIFTEGDDLESLKRNVRDSVHVHFEEEERPRIVRLHFTRDKVIAI